MTLYTMGIEVPIFLTGDQVIWRQWKAGENERHYHRAVVFSAYFNFQKQDFILVNITTEDGTSHAVYKRNLTLVREVDNPEFPKP